MTHIKHATTALIRHYLTEAIARNDRAAEQRMRAELERRKV